MGAREQHAAAARQRGQCAGRWCAITFAGVLPLVAAARVAAADAPAHLEPADSAPGYVALLLINETPFPGEKGWISEADSRATMRSILGVLDSRLHHIPAGYRQVQIASVTTEDIIDVITAGGEKGQCDGFYRDDAGRPAAVARVHHRIDYLMKIATKGSPGRFARLINYAQDLATTYVAGGKEPESPFFNLTQVGDVQVTGRAYSWMTNGHFYNPGGNFVKIPDADQGLLGGNRFFTLRKLKS